MIVIVDPMISNKVFSGAVESGPFEVGSVGGAVIAQVWSLTHLYSVSFCVTKSVYHVVNLSVQRLPCLARHTLQHTAKSLISHL